MTDARTGNLVEMAATLRESLKGEPLTPIHGMSVMVATKLSIAHKQIDQARTIIEMLLGSEAIPEIEADLSMAHDSVQAAAETFADLTAVISAIENERATGEDAQEALRSVLDEDDPSVDMAEGDPEWQDNVN